MLAAMGQGESLQWRCLAVSLGGDAAKMSRHRHVELWCDQDWDVDDAGIGCLEMCSQYTCADGSPLSMKLPLMQPVWAFKALVDMSALAQHSSGCAQLSLCSNLQAIFIP